jgi:hypothetical protein
MKVVRWEYSVVTATEVKELEGMAQSYLDAGWDCVGGVSITNDRGIVLAQAFVRPFVEKPIPLPYTMRNLQPKRKSRAKK